MTRRTLLYFELDPGKYPYREWFTGLPDKKTKLRLDARLRKLERGTLGQWKSLGGGLLELKETFGPGFRIYLGEDGPALVIILAGGAKSTQVKDIRTAREYWDIYRSRKTEGC